MRARLHLFAFFAFSAVVAACGSRTGLLSGDGSSGSSSSSSGSSSSSSSSSSSGSVGFDAGCTEPLWLLFDLDDYSGTPAVSGIYAMRADGTHGHMVTLPHGPARRPSVTPGGSKLLYATFMAPEVDGGPDSTLYLYDFASQSDSPIVTTTELTYSALSPDGQTVAYVSGFALHAINVDGTNDRVLIAGDPVTGPGYGHPVFGTDPRKVIYGATGYFASIGIDGSGNVVLLSTNSYGYVNPAFSPDYSQLVVGLDCDRTSPLTLRVYPFASLPGASCPSGQVLADVSGGGSPNGANDPSWGDNGLIAYSAYPDVFVIPQGGGAPTNMTAQLTGDAGRVTTSDPVWAPACAPIP